MKTKRIILSIFLLLSIFIMASCGKSDVVSELKIKDFAGKTYTNNGIGEVTLQFVSDGDTATFKDGNNSYTVRFKGVDTPESTGKVEKWGVPASLNTKETLKNANSIVLESTSNKPVQDGTTSRYLAYVWYKETAESEYKNYCLELVAKGYSENREDLDDEYYDYFKRAEEQAKSNKLAMWSDSEDSYFPTEAITVSLKDLEENAGNYLYKMVEVEAYIKSTTDKYIYIESLIDSEYYNFNIYSGYSKMPSFFEIGNKIKFVGYVQEYNGSYQIAGIRTYESDPKPYSSIITRGYYLTFGTTSGYGLNYTFEKIKVNNVVLKDGFYEVSGTTKRTNTDDVVEVSFKVKDDKSKDLTKYINKSIIVERAFAEEGISKDDTSIEFIVNNLSDIK